MRMKDKEWEINKVSRKVFNADWLNNLWAPYHTTFNKTNTTAASESPEKL